MKNEDEDDLNLSPEGGGGEQPENKPQEDEHGFNLDEMNTIADFLDARHPDIDAFMQGIFAPQDEEDWDENGEFEEGQKIEWEITEVSPEESEAAQAEEEDEEAEEQEWEEYEQESEPLSKEEEYAMLMEDLELLEQHLDEEEGDSAALKKFKRLVREKLEELRKLDEKVEDAQAALDNALQNLSEKMQELMEKIQNILANAPKVIRVFELGIPQDDLNNFRQKLLALQGQNPNGENIADDTLYQYFQPLAVDADEEITREKLVRIAMRGDVEAFRFLQQIEKEIAQPLRGWARAALLQAQMQMENSLSDESIALVSTGLGGRDNLVRHLCFVPSVEPLTEGKALFIRQEFETQAQADKGQIESFELQPNYVRMQILLPYLQDSRQFALNALENCGFLIGDFWMTSLAEPSPAEVEQWLSEFITKNTINLSDLLNSDH